MSDNKKNNGIMMGGDSDLNRKLVESKTTKAIILNHHRDDSNDSLYERDSGLNHIICRFAKEKNIVFIIDLDELWNNYPSLKIKAKVISRIMQNFRLFNKSRNKVSLINKRGRNDKDIQSLLITLGLNTELSKLAVKN